jgi:hypothetical protein
MERKTDGFFVYKPETAMLKKINSIRRVISAPDATLPPILNNGQVLFSSAASANDEPRSCYNCALFNYDRSCMLMGSTIEIHKLIWPPEPTSDSKQVEYWPVCGYWVPGDPNYGPSKSIAQINPEDAGLGWVNAPAVGLDASGSCCSGANGGDDCDFYMTETPDKREAETGFCRVLQRNVQGMDCCSCWL